MKKFRALVTTLLITLILFFSYTFLTNSSQATRETVIVSRVIDGDTFVTGDGRTIRLLNINTPEKNEPFSSLAPEFMNQFLNKSIEIEVTGTEKYGRLLARAYSSDYLNLYLVEEGFATSFLVEESEQALFKKAQKEAYENAQGVWKRSPYFGCMTIEINKKEELLKVAHTCGSLANWILKDESTKFYTFTGTEPDLFILNSGKGRNTQTTFYWGYEHIWNDDKDSIFVRDSDGLLVFYDQYGY